MNRLESLERRISALESLLGLGTRTVRKHKKHNFKKECSLCGKVYKGAMGLAIHKARSHRKGIKINLL